MRRPRADVVGPPRVVAKEPVAGAAELQRDDGDDQHPDEDVPGEHRAEGAHGLCAELLPERIELDEWGYPIVDETPVPRSLETHARRAVADCPVLALRLERRRADA